MRATGSSTKRTRRPGRPARLAAAAGVAAIALATAGGAVALEGPVILGGDAFPKNGSVSGANALTGWLAMDRSIAYVSPKVGRANDNSVAAIGAQGPNGATTDDAGAAIGRAAARAGLTTTYVEGSDAINAYFNAVRLGNAKPRVIWIAGNQTSNSLDPAELAALNANASTLASFVAGGGGLIAHGDETAYGTPAAPGWLASLLPGAEAYGVGGTGLTLTPEGQVALPGLTDPDISGGAWRNAFRGDLGGLSVLATSTTPGPVEPGTALPQKVLLAGGRAWSGLAPADLSMTATAPAKVDRGDTFTYRFAITNRGPNLASGVRLTNALPTGFTYRGASASRGVCTAGQTPSCLVGDIGVGRIAVVTVFAKAVKSGRLAAHATLSASTPDPTTGGYRVNPVTVSLLTRLRVRVRTAPTVLEGGRLKVRLSVRNTGRRTAKNVVLRSPVVPGFSLESRPAGGRAERGAAIWDIGSVAPGHTRVVVFNLRVDRGTRGEWCIPGLARARNADFRAARSCVTVFLVR